MILLTASLVSLVTDDGLDLSCRAFAVTVLLLLVLCNARNK